jgi:hypothetical protein
VDALDALRKQYGEKLTDLKSFAQIQNFLQDKQGVGSGDVNA